MSDTLRTLETSGLVAILRGVPTDAAEATAAALIAGGVTTFEVTCNTPGALDIVAALTRRFGAQACIGVGTVLTVAEVVAARDAGARFVLSPGFKPEVVHATKAAGLVAVPGAMTPSEVIAAQEAGADIVKIFPAGTLGPGYIRNLLGPLDGSRFMVVGGVDLGNIPDFFRAGAISAGIGGHLVKDALIRDRDWAGLTALAARFVACVAEARVAPPR
ncbi:2-dehydro-3-deoxyphosphogluconate aldolase [uncultured Alphaproteobacteria bacterium]|uniref:2-dehydro-3-deoxyphosphogluconate aldolase n=1 Tax=uncultured Alphaproteobacteria bacterium TaxID=91750 RepID=A0A212KI44_9PROT|nr:2-dehydro-3-deoxyphosphogluconate aldolase [uncultured Alphaproteobacteria bacterium]